MADLESQVVVAGSGIPPTSSTQNPTPASAVEKSAKATAMQDGKVGKKPSAFTRMSVAVEKGFEKAFTKYGYFLARHPIAVFFISFLLAISCGAGFIKLRSEVNADKLWVPQEARAIFDRDRYNSLFGSDIRINSVYIVSKQGGKLGGENLLRRDVIEEVYSVHRAIYEEINVTSLGAPGKRWFLKDLCLRTCTDCPMSDVCVMTTPLDFWYDWSSHRIQIDSTVTDEEVLERVQTERAVAFFPLPISADGRLGGIKRDENDKIINATAMGFSYILRENASMTEDIEAFEQKIIDLMAKDFQHIKVYVQAESSITGELGRSIQTDLLSLQLGIVFILIYALLVLGKFHPVRNRSVLAFTGVISIGLAIVISFGLSSAAGFFLTPVTNVLPFILIGIGVDDMFVLVSELERQPKSLSVEEKIARTMGHAGVSITITSLTDVLAFALGATTTLPALKSFCVFAVFGILGDFLMQITFFGAVMVFDARRIKQNRADCLCCLRLSMDKGPGPCGSTGCCYGKFMKEEGVLRSIIEKYYSRFLSRKWVKIMTLILFPALFGVCIWGATNLKQDFSFRFFVPGDSYLLDVFDVGDIYFAEQGQPLNIVTEGDSWTLSEVQAAYIGYSSTIDQSPFVKNDSVSNWMEGMYDWLDGRATVTICVTNDFNTTIKGWTVLGTCTDGKRIRRNVPPINGYLTDEVDFYEMLEAYLAQRASVNGNLVRDENNTVPFTTIPRIKAGRITATLKNLPTADTQVAAMVALRNITDTAPSSMGYTYPYNFEFLYFEQYAVIEHEAIVNVVLAISAVALISFVMIGNLIGALYVVLCIVMIDIDLLGLMWFTGVTINSVSVVNIVLAIGLAVDYCAHIAHSFIIAKGSKNERMVLALKNMGSSVFHGAFSTFVAVLVLGFSNSYIFFIFFLMFFLTIALGILHGMLFLPVLLSVAGPGEVNFGSSGQDKEKGHGVNAIKPVSSKIEVVVEKGERRTSLTPPGSVENGNKRSSGDKESSAKTSSLEVLRAPSPDTEPVSL
eukprot:CAMPEP_0113876152 /NCGR_PEP_ID=MMETSP0780_2-20120614/5331_1 /TAXON_ID=652834 /ORGANISM="Palpitomonas bilix" /LENGTH=1021 /DNA_ID=CAMNT_0000862205 /DNA_START=52 /DNA_END=3117 /DNA_ORIENTATION=+ /assembly_acc=CAM_ASM_000599